MHFTLATALAVMPLLSSATPLSQQPRGSIPIRKRSNFKRSDGTVNIDALKSNLQQTVAKVHRGFQAFEVNTGSAHPAKIATPTKRDGGSASDPLTDDSQQLWYGEIEVGTPAVKYTVDFDTGSSDLFLPGPDCSENCDQHTKYDPSKSSTSKDVGADFQLQYGDGSTVSGEQFTDTVTIAGLTTKSATVGAAKQYSEGFGADFPADGLMGMGFKQISEYKADPVFQALVADGATTQPVFGFKLAQNGSELSLGAVNKELVKGDLTNVKVTQEGYWQVQLDGISVGDNQAVQSISSIVDTGTTLIVGDADNVKAVYDQIEGSSAVEGQEGFYQFSCDSVPDNVQLTYGGKAFTLSAESFNMGPADNSGQNCVGGIASMDVGADFWIVGDVFLQNVYAVFDVGNSQVQLGDLA